MANENFTWTESEKNVTTNEAQLDMLQRLVDFVNASLAEIRSLKTDMTQVKTDIEDLKTPETSNPK